MSTRVKENGDVILDMKCGKGFRLYGIKVIPFVPKERNFTDFKVDFTTDPYTVALPANGILPDGVTIEGSWHDAQHGYNSSTVTVPVDGSCPHHFRQLHLQRIQAQQSRQAKMFLQHFHATLTAIRPQAGSTTAMTTQSSPSSHHPTVRRSQSKPATSCRTSK